MFEGPKIDKEQGLGARSASSQNITGIVFGGVVPDTGTYTALGTTVELIQAKDADALGLTAAYDAAKKVLVRHHIDEYFRLNPNGNLFIMIVAQTVTLAQMCTLANPYVKKLINDSGKKVKDVGVVRNPATGYTSTLTNGLDADVLTAVPLAQLLVEDFITQNVYLDHVWIEGRELNGAYSAIKDLRTMDSANVRVVVSQDSVIAALDPLYAKYASIGTALGMNGIRRVMEDLGSINVLDNPDKSVDKYTLNNGVVWEAPAVSSGALTSSLTPAEIKLLQDKGYIFADVYPSYEGVFFNKGNACTAIDSDFAYGTRMRVWNKAARLAVKKFIPKYNSIVATENNKITPITISDWERDINNSRNGIGTMVRDGECKSSNVFIDPNLEVDPNETEVVVNMEIGVFNYARKISGKLKMTV